jgi:hypothetical protein
MFRASYRQPRRRAHPAPVENRDWQITIMAKKKQTLFFALSSPQFKKHEILRSGEIPNGARTNIYP